MECAISASAEWCLALLSKSSLDDYEFSRLLQALRTIAGDTEDAVIDLGTAVTSLKDSRIALSESAGDEAGEFEREMQDSMREISGFLLRLRELVTS